MKLKRAATLLMALALLSPNTLGAQAVPVKRPNIVILLADDWGFTDVGAFGGEIATPHIDALAAKGVRFSNFHVAGSCSPTRAMLQTGVINHRAGLGNMPETIPSEHLGKPGYEAQLNNRVVTIADQLRMGGYRTYLTGKWHLGYTPDTLPTARGYDRAFALAQSGADNFEDKPNLLIYDKTAWSEDGKPVKLPKRFYSSTLIVDRMISYIGSGKASGKPFLASVNFIANHIPVQARDADIEAYAGRYNAGWTVLRKERRTAAIAKGVMPADVRTVTMNSSGDWSKLSAQQRQQRAGAMAAYAAMGTAMDREIGRLVAHLKAIGVYENTIFVFLSDNGAEATDPMNMGAFTRWNANQLYDQNIGQQGRPGSLTAQGAGFASASVSPLRGYKFTASEGGLRVPMIITWPGNPALKAGSVAKGFAHVTDLSLTLLKLAGFTPQQGSFAGRRVEPMIGMDLSPMLTGAASSVHSADKPLGYELSGNAVLFKGDYKLVKNLPPYGDGRWRLYNITADPGESNDLSGSDPQRFAAMQRDYAAFAKANNVLPMPEGYTAPKQIFANALRNLLIPRLLALWPAGLLLVMVIATMIWWRRRRPS
ncbi:arylsulfatase [Sphingorhabdus wooponensis]|uniref:Arylsulfatase n=1 Tax=Sphingorhabdus wooponensis TaxID=940136 RepID=A0A426RUC0_9SPHN|nr:arylsulfatase [Sphingorhabdus wooponensis]RRQ52593.1 arylsulfatase [Sphingorhabdus wooponensis]